MSQDKKPHVLVTGGAGYVGSHSAVALQNAGYTPVLVDNLQNSDMQAVRGIQKLCSQEVPFHAIDVRDATRLHALFQDFIEAGNPIRGILHFAAQKSVGESVNHPAMYASNNVGGLGTLLHVAREFEIRHIVFSSSCTVYGEPVHVPVDEGTPFQEAESPYGWTKQASERVLRDHAAAQNEERIALLRYFNPIGAHPSAIIGELPLGVPNNLVPFLTQAVAGVRDRLTVFGGDYPTPDGTCIRDYLHVMDLAEAHVAALQWCFAQKTASSVVRPFNLGTGKGASVLEVIKAFEHATGEAVPYVMGERRSGDVVSIWANASRAREELGWTTKRSLETSLADAWKWQQTLKRE